MKPQPAPIDTETFDAIQDLTPEIAQRAVEISSAYAKKLTPEALLLMLKTSDLTATLNLKISFSVFTKHNGEKSVNISAVAKADGKVIREEEGMIDSFVIPGTGPDRLPGFY